jgi:hypothetical protein
MAPSALPSWAFTMFPVPTATSPATWPVEEKTSTSPVVALMLKYPFASAVTERLVPFTFTVAKGTASPLTFLTVPVIGLTWPTAMPMPDNRKANITVSFLMLFWVYGIPKKKES